MIEFIRDADSNYVLEIAGIQYANFSFVLAAPIREGKRKSIAILDDNHQEIAWIDELDGLSEHIQQFIISQLQLHATYCEINTVEKISSRLYPSQWTVTDTSDYQYVFWIDNEDDIMHLHDDLVMIRTDIKKLFIIRDIDLLNEKSRVLLRPFIFLA